MPVNIDRQLDLVAQVVARVRPTVCPTYSQQDMRREGRISEFDLDTIELVVESLRAKEPAS